MKKTLLAIALSALPCAHAMENKLDSIVRKHNLVNGDSINVQVVGYDSKNAKAIVGHDAERITVEAKNVHFLSTAPQKKTALVTIVTIDLNTEEWTEQQNEIEQLFHNDSRSDKEQRNASPFIPFGTPLTVSQLKEIAQEYIKGNFTIKGTGSDRSVDPKNQQVGRFYY